MPKQGKLLFLPFKCGQCKGEWAIAVLPGSDVRIICPYCAAAHTRETGQGAERDLQLMIRLQAMAGLLSGMIKEAQQGARERAQTCDTCAIHINRDPSREVFPICETCGNNHVHWRPPYVAGAGEEVRADELEPGDLEEPEEPEEFEEEDR